MGCVATVRGAVEDIPGVAGVQIEPGKRDFRIDYDAAKVEPDALLQAIRAAGEKGTKIKS
ncbi:MAG: heavy-metal-associated domain-containing protein [bacterium]|nr:heavy-metal-associated domain-containing protein [bacterium]